MTTTHDGWQDWDDWATPDVEPEQPASSTTTATTEVPDLQLDPRDVAELDAAQRDQLAHYQRLAADGNTDALQPIADFAAIGQRLRLAKIVRAKRTTTSQTPVKRVRRPAASLEPGCVSVIGTDQSSATHKTIRTSGLRWATADGAAQLSLRIVSGGEQGYRYLDLNKRLDEVAIDAPEVLVWLSGVLRDYDVLLVDSDVLRYSLRGYHEREADNPAAVDRIAGELVSVARQTDCAIVVVEPTQLAASYVNQSSVPPAVVPVAHNTVDTPVMSPDDPEVAAAKRALKRMQRDQANEVTSIGELDS